jgi:hypothetical protein
MQMPIVSPTGGGFGFFISPPVGSKKANNMTSAENSPIMKVTQM